MKIAQVVSTFPPYRGGTGKVAEEYARVLTKLGHEVTVLTAKYGEAPAQDDYPFEVQRLRPFFRFGNAAFVPQLAKKLGQFDAIHLHYPFFGGAEMLNASMNRYLNQKRYVITYHQDAAAPGAIGLIFNFYRDSIMPTIIENAHVVTASSFDYLEHSDLKATLAKKPELFVELPFGVDLERFSPGPKDNVLLQSQGIRPEEKVVLFVGGLDRAHHFKGAHFLIKAAKILKEAKTPVRLVLAGSGDLVPSYKILVKELGLSESVAFLGSVSEEDLPKWYRSADLLVLPSVGKSEAFGIVLLEAMASGIPAVASNIPGVRSVCRDGETGLLAAPAKDADLAEKIGRILGDSELATRMGQKGREVAEQKHNWDNIGQKLAGLYEDNPHK